MKKYANNDLPITHTNEGDVKKHVVSDAFFKKGHIGVKIRNLATALLFWLIALLPFILVGYAIFINHDERIIHLTIYLFKFFGLWCLFFLIVIPIMTLLNNHRIHYIYHADITYNPKRLNQRKTWLHKYYVNKFGHVLHWRNTYRIAKDNNIPVDYIMRHYRNTDKKLKQRKGGART